MVYFLQTSYRRAVRIQWQGWNALEATVEKDRNESKAKEHRTQ